MPCRAARHSPTRGCHDAARKGSVDGSPSLPLSTRPPVPLLFDQPSYVDLSALPLRGAGADDQALAAPDELGTGHGPDEADSKALDDHLELRASGEPEPLSQLGGDDHTPCL